MSAPAFVRYLALCMRARVSSGSISREELAIGTQYEPPATDVESLLATLFSELLDVDRVGANDDFFILGGDSLQAESLCLAIAKQTGTHIRTSLLIDCGTPKKLASLILAGGVSESEPHADTGRPPIFLVHGRLGLTLLKPPFLKGLAPAQGVHVLELPGLRGDRPAYDSIEEIATAYVSELCSKYPKGPVFLAAFCRGALIALEMANQLKEQARLVQQLVLFDPSLPPGTIRYFSREFGGKVVLLSGKNRFWKWLEEQLRCCRHLILLGRWTDGTRKEDFADARLRALRVRSMKRRSWLARLTGRDRYRSEIKISLEARAKLLVAYRHYLPPSFDGPACILASETRRMSFVDRSVTEARIWGELLPQLEVRVVGATHADVLGANTSESARVAQEIFDIAAKRASPAATK